MIKDHIVIIGFMGAGKTTVATALGRMLGCEVVDLDDSVKRCEQRGPKEIIEQDGESVFREIETKVLREVLKDNPTGVVALGGGTWTVAINRRLLGEHGSFSVWLDAPFELCWKRIKASEEVRPLAISQESAKRRYQERLEIYGLADCRVAVNEEESADEIAKRVAALIVRKENS